MKEEFYLSLLIFCTLWSQGLAVISNENVDESSDLLTRKKRVINRAEGGIQPAHITLSRHIVQIQLYDEFECAGSILQADMILTSRTCLARTNEKYTVLSGSLIKNNGTPHRVLHSVKLLNYNLALLKIHPPIVLSPNGNQKIDIYEGSLPPNSAGLLSGWGCTNISPNGQRTYPHQLMATLLPIMSYRDCERAVLASNGLMPHSSVHVICTLDPRRQRGGCYGDEGGSLVYAAKLIGVYAPIGRVNLGVHPDVFMALSDTQIIQWINHTKREFQNMHRGHMFLK